MNPDIVERLREEGFITHMARLPRESKILHEAADEIERLRNEVHDLRMECSGYLVGNQMTLKALHDANAIAKQYKTERDEARQKLSRYAMDMINLLDEDMS